MATSMAVNLNPAARAGATEPWRPEAAPNNASHHDERILRFGTKWQLFDGGFVCHLALPESAAEPGFIGLK
jgi:hypothetical protein